MYSTSPTTSSNLSRRNTTTAPAAGGGGLKRNHHDDSLCDFCQKDVAVVSVQVRTRSRDLSKKHSATGERHLCLLHYYSTSAVRGPDVTVLLKNSDRIKLKQQIPATQDLFATAYVQLQQQLAEQAAHSFAAHAHDPLAIVSEMQHNPSKNSKRFKKQYYLKKPPLKPSPKEEDTASDGGFLRNVPLPERLVKTQLQQAQLQKQMLKRMEQAATSKSAGKDDNSTKITKNNHPSSVRFPSVMSSKRQKTNDVSQRRKPSRRIIWNTVFEDETKKEKKPSQPTSSYILQDTTELATDITCSSCGTTSSQVQILSSNASRNQDMAKGETWGTKDRGDDVVTRCQCLTCGKVWNEVS